MPIDARWDDDDKMIYRYTITGRWTLAEFLDQSAAFKAALAKVNHPVYTIVDVRHARMAAGTMMEAARFVFAERTPNDEMMVLLGGGTIYQQIYVGVEKILAQIFITLQPSVVWVSSDEEAYRVIADHRAKRNPPPE